MDVAGIAEVIYSMCEDMGCADYEEAKAAEIKKIESELHELKANGSILYDAFKCIAECNQ